MSDRNCTEQSFLKDVAGHRMTILRDDGVYRHIRFKKPDSGDMYFDLMTWPGWLCYSGDMGTYVFQRLPDMFEFFRTDRWRPHRGWGILYINLGYWSEKIQASDRDGVKRYSAEKFKAVVADWLDGAEASQEVRDAVAEEVLSCADDGEYRARMAANDFEREGFRFTDFWEADLTEYTYRFVWCCYAIAWGVQQYDNASAATPCTTCARANETCPIYPLPSYPRRPVISCVEYVPMVKP